MDLTKLDGYKAVDESKALEEGLEFVYPTPIPDTEIRIRARYSGAENTALVKARERAAHKRKIREKTGRKTTDKEIVRDTAALWYDHVVIDWSTTVTSGGKPLKPTRDLFIDMMATELFTPILAALVEETADRDLFAKEAEAETAKN